MCNAALISKNPENNAPKQMGSQGNPPSLYFVGLRYFAKRNEMKQNETVLCETVLCEMVLCEMKKGKQEKYQETKQNGLVFELNLHYYSLDLNLKIWLRVRKVTAGKSPGNFSCP